MKDKIVNISDIDYAFKKVIGNGGNGVVHLAISKDDRKDYAIKLVSKENIDSTKIVRFKNEIEFEKNSEHPNILKIIDWCETETDIYCVMPFYPTTLRKVIDGNGCSNDSIFNYINQLCKAIKYAHENNVVHRDIKPENILIDNDILVLADFGIAHFVDSTLTKKGELLANRNYSSPEQKIKNNALNITKATDVFSLGAVINELFTKRNPLGSEYVTVSQAVPYLDEVDELIYRCMKQNPEERPTIDEVLLKMNLIEGEILDTLEDIEDWLCCDVPDDVDEDDVSRIIKRASYDILIAKSLFEAKSVEEINLYNFNYHMDIHYSISDELKAIYFQRKVYDICFRKFNYESYSYIKDKTLKSLDLKLEKDKYLYENLRAVVSKYKVSPRYGDLEGKIYKLFLSCFDYHCEEILRAITKVEEGLIDFNDAPFIYILQRLRQVNINIETIEALKIEEHIEINWEATFACNYRDDVLYDRNQNDEMMDTLLKFCEKFNAVFSKQDKGYFNIMFSNREFYNEFKNFALELAKPYYIFEGDVLDILRINREYNGIVELYPLSDFDITNTIAKIIGNRTDY